MKRLPTSQLIPGMIVAQDILNYDDSLMIPQGTELTDKLITKLELYGIMIVYIKKSVNEPVIPDNSRNLSHSMRFKNSLEFNKFKKVYELNVNAFRCDINNMVSRNITLDIDTLLKNAINIITNTKAQISIIDMLQCMRNYDDSTYAHCMNVALICNVLATWLKFSREQIELTTACGLLHDIGKLLVPYDIIAKPGKLSESEYHLMKKHPYAGYQLLKELYVNEHICNAALMHHERNDGSGYPLRRAGNQIDMYARIVSIADVYDAMTAARCYRGPLCPFRVIEFFEAEGFQKYDVKFLLTFLENVVNSYIQNRCRLSDGREGYIIYVNKDHLSRPIVQCGSEYVNLVEHPDLSIEEIL